MGTGRGAGGKGGKGDGKKGAGAPPPLQKCDRCHGMHLPRLGKDHCPNNISLEAGRSRRRWTPRSSAPTGSARIPTARRQSAAERAIPGRTTGLRCRSSFPRLLVARPAAKGLEEAKVVVARAAARRSRVTLQRTPLLSQRLSRSCSGSSGRPMLRSCKSSFLPIVLPGRVPRPHLLVKNAERSRSLQCRTCQWFQIPTCGHLDGE